MTSTPRFEIVPWSFVGTEEVAEWTVLDNGRDTLIVDDNREILQQAIDTGVIQQMLDA